MELTPALHPQGQCCKASFNREQLNKSFDFVEIRFITPGIVNKMGRIYLLDRKSSSYFQLNTFNMDKHLLFNERNVITVKVKVSEEHSLEEDPISNCHLYPADYLYHQVCIYSSFIHLLGMFIKDLFLSSVFKMSISQML